MEMQQSQSSHRDICGYDKCDNASKISLVKTPVELEDRYDFIRELGHGAQGHVFLARKRSDHTRVAIKQLQIDSVSTWKEYTLFKREADVLATIQVKGVACLHEACEYLEANPPCSYIVTDYIEGQTLDALIKSGFRLTAAQCADIIYQILEILEQLHHHDPVVIHRDIKPANIMLTKREYGYNVHLIDFGAVANPQIQSGGSTVAGTYGYMPPEQLTGHPEPASDIYALAGVCTFILCGVEPSDMETVNFRPQIEPHLKSAPEAIVSTIKQMLAPNVTQRLADISVLKERFEQFRHEQFDVDTNHNAEYGKNDYLEALKKVVRLGAHENIELWQHYKSNDNCELNDSDIRLYANPMLRNEFKYNYEISLGRGAKLIVPLLILLFLGIVTAKFCPENIKTLLCSIFATGAVILSVKIFIISIFSASRYKKVKASLDDDKNSEMNARYRKIRKTLLMNGRKTLATVTEIAYENLPETGDKVLKVLESASYSYRVIKSPSFTITYKFNPPDDASPDDLFHTIKVHRDPEPYLKVGDTIPILYLITDVMGKHVSSMPFPFPLDDFEQDDDYIYVDVLESFG